jgi:fatty acid desaturase
VCGFLFFSSSIAICATLTYFYLSGTLPWWAVIPLMGLPLSTMHELEHDLIHNLYFKKLPIVQDAMFLVIWVMKLHGSPTLSPQ